MADTSPLQALMAAQYAGGGIDPSAMGDYYQSQKQQMLAQMLMGNAQRATQTPQDWNSMRLVPKMSPLAGLAGAVSGYMGGKMYDKSLKSQQAYMQALYGGGQPSQQQAPQDGSAPQPQGGMQAPQAQGQAQSPQQSQDNRIIPGTNKTMRQASIAAAMGNPAAMEDYKHGLATLGAVSSLQGEFNTAGTTTGDRSAIANALLRKGTTDPVRGDSSIMDYKTGQFTATAPKDGTLQTWDNGVPSQNRIAGADAASAAAAQAEASGKAAGTPTIVTGSSGVPIATFPARLPGSSAPAGVRNQPRLPIASGDKVSYAPPPNHIMSPTEAETNKGLATQVPEVMNGINEKAQQATLGLASLSEMKNLAQGFNPGKGSEVLAAIGNVAMSVGMDPKTVKQMTQTNPGDVEAFEKQTAALASEVVKQMSNRVTQMEFKTYLANNPNALLTGDGLKRVISYMEKGFNSTLDQQQEAHKFLEANPQTPERLITTFPSLYNQRKAADIKAGKFDSVNPSLSDVRTRSDINAASANQGGGVQVPPTVKDPASFQSWAAQHPELKGKIVIFADGSKGRL